jgi:DNA topoisomerase-1
VTDAFCPDHDLPELIIHDGDGDPWELGCPICNFEEFQARRATRDLDDLDGVGEKTAAKLSDADIESLADLQAADPDDVASRVSGVSADRVRDWQEQAESAG